MMTIKLKLLIAVGLLLSTCSVGCNYSPDKAELERIAASKAASAERANEERARAYLYSLIEDKPGDPMTIRLGKRPTLEEMKQSIPLPARKDGDEWIWSYKSPTREGWLDTWHAKFGDDGRLFALRSPNNLGEYTIDWQKFQLGGGL